MRKSYKIIVLYLALLGLALSTMISLWPYQKQKNIPKRDLSEIRKEGVLRIVTEYNPEDTSGYQYEFSRGISKLSGLEIQLQMENSYTNSLKALNQQQADIIIWDKLNTKEVSFSKCTLRKESTVLSDSLKLWLKQLRQNGNYN